MVTGTLWCKLRTLSQKIKTYHLCNAMKLSAIFFKTFLGFLSLFFISNTLKGLHQEKNNHPMEFIATKAFFMKKKDLILNDFIKES